MAELMGVGGEKVHGHWDKKPVKGLTSFAFGEAFGKVFADRRALNGIEWLHIWGSWAASFDGEAWFPPLASSSGEWHGHTD